VGTAEEVEGVGIYGEGPAASEVHFVPVGLDVGVGVGGGEGVLRRGERVEGGGCW